MSVPMPNESLLTAPFPPFRFEDGKLHLKLANIGELTAGKLETPVAYWENGRLVYKCEQFIVTDRKEKVVGMNWENIKAWLAAKPAIFYYGIALGFFLGAVIF